MADEQQNTPQRLMAPGATVYFGGQAAGFAPGAAIDLHPDQAERLREAGVALVAHDPDHPAPEPEPGLLPEPPAAPVAPARDDG